MNSREIQHRRARHAFAAGLQLLALAFVLWLSFDSHSHQAFHTDEPGHTEAACAVHLFSHGSVDTPAPQAAFARFVPALVLHLTPPRQVPAPPRPEHLRPFPCGPPAP